MTPVVHTEAELLLARLPGMAYRAVAETSRPLLAVSRGAKAVTGYPSRYLVGRRLGALVHPADATRVASELAQAIAALRPFEVEYRLLRPDGSVVVVNDRGAPLAGPDGHAREVAGYVDNAAVAAAKQDWFRHTHEAVVALARSSSCADGDLEAFAPLVTEAAAEHLSVPRAGVWLLNHDRSELQLVDLFLHESRTHVGGVVIHANDYPAYFAALSSGRAIAAHDAARDPATAEFADNYLREYDIRSMLDSTIRLGGEVVGVICNEQVGIRRHWSLPEISYAGELADQMAQAIANRRRRRAEREALSAKHRSEAKSRFLATMSHEIRTPMNGVLGMARMLEETELTEKQTELVRTIRDSGELLLTIINDVLDFARIEADKLAIQAKSASARGLVDRALRIVGPSARDKGIDLRSEVDEGIPDRCMLDEGRVEQILVNLLGNAIKFTERGLVSLTLAREGGVEDPRLRFDVEDTGIGMDPSRIQTLFEPFEQGASQRRDGHVGTGLGLAISRRLAELMGGTLEAESEPGVGSRFSVTLPLVACDAAAEDGAEVADAASGNEGADLASLRVLVAEDNTVNRRVIETMLGHLGISPVLCRDGREVLECLAEASERFDVILMDCEMPRMSGFEATRRLRGSASVHQDTPVVALTAHALPEFRDRAREAGMDEYLTKPLDLDEITAVLRRVRSGRPR